MPRAWHGSGDAPLHPQTASPAPGSPLAELGILGHPPARRGGTRSLGRACAGATPGDIRELKISRFSCNRLALAPAAPAARGGARCWHSPPPGHGEREGLGWSQREQHGLDAGRTSPMQAGRSGVKENPTFPGVNSTQRPQGMQQGRPNSTEFRRQPERGALRASPAGATRAATKDRGSPRESQPPPLLRESRG